MGEKATFPKVISLGGSSNCGSTDKANTVQCFNRESFDFGLMPELTDMEIDFCASRGGRLLCPLNYPYMCSDCNPNGETDHCCVMRQSVCEEFGGLLEKNKCPNAITPTMTTEVSVLFIFS